MPSRLNKPKYLDLYHNGKFQETCEAVFKLLECCQICPRICKVNRLKDQKGFCHTGLKPKVYSFMAHHGEEPPISGKNGSGTIFFTNCNMGCIYCQNYEFSQLGQGREVDFNELADIMLKLQGMGCHNINFVTPTHVMPQILKALLIAIPKGLKIPLVYNTSGYELASIIRLLDGIIDVYLPDMRYADPQKSLKYSVAPDYPKYNQEAIKEMHRQVGIAMIDKNGIINKGLIIRHLVLPNNVSGTRKIMSFIATEISEETYISLMSQYLPYYKAKEEKEITRRLKDEEYEEAKKAMEESGLYNGWVQESYGSERFAGVNIKPSL